MYNFDVLFLRLNFKTANIYFNSFLLQKVVNISRSFSNQRHLFQKACVNLHTFTCAHLAFIQSDL